MDPLLEHFGLKEAPFRISPDPRFLYLSPPVNEAVARCQYLVKQRVGPLYIYGPIGSGKTSILKRLHESFSADNDSPIAHILSPNLKTSNAFLRTIMGEFGVKTAYVFSVGRGLA